MTVPKDSILPHLDTELAVFELSGGRWERLTTIHGNGRFWPAASIYTDKLRVFWSGISAEYQDEFEARIVYGTDIFSCALEGRECMSGSSLEQIEETENHLFIEKPYVSDDGRIHLLVHDRRARHIVLDASGERLSEEFLGYVQYPGIIGRNDELIFTFRWIYEGETQNFLSIWMQRYGGNGWGEWEEIFHDSDLLPHNPQLFIGTDGAYHLAFYAKNRAASSSGFGVYYIASPDQGTTWTKPILLHEFDDLFFGKPEFASDGRGTVYLWWSHVGRLLDGQDASFDHYVVTISESAVSEPERLFPQLPATSKIQMAVDAMGTVHAVWRHQFDVYHSTARLPRGGR